MAGKVYFPIFLKLILLMTALLVIIALAMAWQNSKLFQQVSTEREENFNLVEANSRSRQVEGVIRAYADKIKFFGLDLLRTSISRTEISEMIRTSFQNDSDLILITVKKRTHGPSQTLQTLVNNDIFKENNLRADYFEKLGQRFHFPEDSVFEGKIPVYNVSYRIPLLMLGIPLLKDESGVFTHIAMAFVRLDRIQRIFAGEGERILYLIDFNGKVVAHPDEQLALNGKNLGHLPVVKDAIGSPIRAMQKYFKDPETDQNYLAAFAKTPFGLTTIAQISEKIIETPVRIVKEQTFFLLGVIISAAFFLVFLFSINLTGPIEKLLEFTKKISQGNFTVKAVSKFRSLDEVGSLAVAFDKMTEGLKERDKIKTMFNKFHGTTLTDELLQNPTRLEGHSNKVTVLFCDIREFTDFSEKHTPREVVAFLNDYLEKMVTIIVSSGGVVDKFVGDAIMAVWGVPIPRDMDAINAVTTCLQMRQELYRFNEARISKGKDPIKFGMGLHSGKAISGTIGSQERQEYTVIGDTVNAAFRIESLTKFHGTDCLISDSTATLIKDKFVLESVGAFRVKGKTEQLKLYKVNGFYNRVGKGMLVKTPYSNFTPYDYPKKDC